MLTEIPTNCLEIPKIEAIVRVLGFDGTVPKSGDDDDSATASCCGCPNGTADGGGGSNTP